MNPFNEGHPEIGHLETTPLVRDPRPLGWPPGHHEGGPVSLGADAIGASKCEDDEGG